MITYASPSDFDLFINNINGAKNALSSGAGGDGDERDGDEHLHTQSQSMSLPTDTTPAGNLNNSAATNDINPSTTATIILLMTPSTTPLLLLQPPYCLCNYKQFTDTIDRRFVASTAQVKLSTQREPVLALDVVKFLTDAANKNEMKRRMDGEW